MLVIALLLPVLLVLILFGLDALENALFPPLTEPAPTNAGESPESP
ncbi:hypothetical protein ACFWFU_38670 [Streptomyces sp. NPDC060235]